MEQVKKFGYNNDGTANNSFAKKSTLKEYLSNEDRDDLTQKLIMFDKSIMEKNCRKIHDFYSSPYTCKIVLFAPTYRGKTGFKQKQFHLLSSIVYNYRKNHK